MSLHPPSRARTDRAFAPPPSRPRRPWPLAGGAQAFEIDTGNPDLSVRWDNTVRLNLGDARRGARRKIGNSALADEGTYSFDKGDVVAKRLDLLSEFDVVYKKRYGVRVSGAAWYDGAYGDTSQSNPNPPLVNIPSYIGNQYSRTTKRLYRGGPARCSTPSSSAASTSATCRCKAKLGRHTIYWGESLFLGGNLHSISYAQNPLDLQKGFATPGTEAKELFRPLNQLSLQAQVTDTLSVAGQYMLEWESARYPEGGTYLGPVDFVFNGPDRQFLSPAASASPAAARASEPKQHRRVGPVGALEPGVARRHDGLLLPQLRRQAAADAADARSAPASRQYNLIYADNIDLFGVSLAKNIGGVSVGAELSYRHNTPLNARCSASRRGCPAQGDTKGPRGDTWHGAGQRRSARCRRRRCSTARPGLPKLHVVALDQGDQRREPVQRASASRLATPRHAPAKDKWDGCVDQELRRHRRRVHAHLVPGASRASTCRRRSPTRSASSGNARDRVRRQPGPGQLQRSASGADVQQKYRFDLKYIDFVGRYKDNGTAVTVAERPDHVPEGPRLRQPDLQDHLLTEHDHEHATHTARRRPDGRRRRIARPGRRHRRRGQGPGHARSPPIGAEKAANKDGTIPAYTGGLTTPPAGFKAGDGIRPNPFASEKPRLAIDAKNMAQYAAQADRRHQGADAEVPDASASTCTRRIARVAFPKCVTDNTAKNAVKAKTLNEGRSIEGAHAGFPFPIPKTGNEAMWNHLVRFNGQAYEAKYRNLNVDASGRTDAGHRRRQHPGISRSGTTARPRPTPTGASSSPTPARRAAPARR